MHCDLILCDDYSDNVINSSNMLYCQPFSNNCQLFRYNVRPLYGQADSEPSCQTVNNHDCQAKNMASMPSITMFLLYLLPLINLSLSI